MEDIQQEMEAEGAKIVSRHPILHHDQPCKLVATILSMFINLHMSVRLSVCTVTLIIVAATV